MNAPPGRGSWFTAKNCSQCVIRDVEVAGPSINSGNSSAVSLASGSVWIRGSIHGFGNTDPNSPENDFHGIKTTSGTDIWILEAEIYNVAGDSVQVGDASRGSAQRVYIGGGYYHHNRENAVDIKDSTDIVVSGVLMEGFHPSSTSSGAALVVHDDAFDAKIYNNIVGDSNIGMVSSGRSGHVIDSNTIQASSMGIDLRGTTNITVSNNIINAPIPIRVGGGVSGTVQDQ